MKQEIREIDSGYRADIRGLVRLVSNLSCNQLQTIAAQFEGQTDVAIDVPGNPFPITWKS